MMKTRNGASALAVILVFCVAADARPPDYAITFNLRETIGDPTSEIDFTVTMGLMKEEQDGDDIGWDVVVVTIRELDDNGNVIETWFKTQPNVDTTSSLDAFLQPLCIPGICGCPPDPVCEPPLPPRPPPKKDQKKEPTEVPKSPYPD